MIVQNPEPNFDYNSTRNKLILAEYGRNVQNMVKYICGLPTKDERNKYAQVVIDLMGFLNPHLRDVADFKHKLWDHLHIISDFKIDVDSPYPKPDPETIHFKPEVLPYPQNRIRYKHYGRTVDLMIKKAKETDETDRKNHMVNAIANFMKLAYVTWNKDHVADEQILSDLKDISGGDFTLDHVVLNKIDIKQVVTKPVKNSSKQRSGGGSNNNQNQNNNRNQNNNNNRQRNNNNNYKRG